MEKKQGRKRLRPWLELHCNQKTFKGLKWLDQEKRIFIISWKHQSNRGWDSSDAEIFKAWAVFTGKHKEGDPENPPEWKTRLRTALTKLSDIEEEKSLHNLSDPDNPYKAYRFLDEVSSNKSSWQGSPLSESGYSGSPASLQASPSPALQADFLEPSDSEMECTENIEKEEFFGMPTNIPTVVFDRGGNLHSNSMNKLDSPTIDANLPHYNNFSSDRNGSHSNPVSDISNISMPADFQNMSAPEIPSAMPEIQSVMPSDLEQIDSGNLMRFKELPENLSIGSSLPSFESLSSSSMASLNHPALKIKVYFVEQLVHEDSIDDKARLFCGDLKQQAQAEAHVGVDVFGPMNLKQISIPEIDKLSSPISVNEKQKEIIRNIQKNMDRGLLLGGNDTHIFAQRLCKARVFVWTQERKNERLDRENNNPKCVFDLDCFKQQLDRHVKNTDTKPQPLPFIIFSFGQEYKADIPFRKRVLLYLKVTHVVAEKMLRQVMNEQDSENSEVIISNSTSDDHFAELVKNMRL